MMLVLACDAGIASCRSALWLSTVLLSSVSCALPKDVTMLSTADSNTERHSPVLVVVSGSTASSALPHLGLTTSAAVRRRLSSSSVLHVTSSCGSTLMLTLALTLTDLDLPRRLRNLCALTQTHSKRVQRHCRNYKNYAVIIQFFDCCLLKEHPACKISPASSNVSLELETRANLE